MAKRRLPPETVFVSYAREDLAFTQRLAADLQARGIPIWIDQKIEPGIAWDQEIEAAIRGAATMLVVLSPDSVDSSTVGDEVSFALEDGDLVIPLLFRPCQVPLRLARLQRVDFSGDYESGFNQLVQRLRPQEDGTVRPNAVSAAPTPSPLRARPPRWAIPVLSGGAALAGALGLAFFLRAEPVPEEASKTLPSAAPRVSRATLAAKPEKNDDDSASAGDQLLEQYRAVVDSRSRWLMNKQPWLAAAESFESALHRPTLAEAERRALRSKAEFSRGRFALLEGQLGGAEARFRAAIGADSNWALPYLELSAVLTRFGRYPDAYAQARLARKAEPNSWLTAIAAGPIYAAEGKHSDAIGVYEAAQANYDLPQVSGNLALAYHAAGQHDERAGELAQKALERDPELVPALTVLGEQALERGAAKKALTYSQRMIDTAVFDVSAWLLHGDVLLALGRKPLAKQAYQRAIELFSSTRQLGAPRGRLQVVQAAIAAGNLPPLRSNAAEAARSHPKSGARPGHVDPSWRPGPDPLSRSEPKSPNDMSF